MRRGTNLCVILGVVCLLVCVNIVGAGLTELAKLKASDGAARDDFGWSVSVDGDYAIVGAPGDDDNGDDSGSAYIFKRNGTSWSQQAKLVASDGDANDQFGYSVSISGDYAIVGAWCDDVNGSDFGSAYIFKREGISWNEQAKLVSSDGEAYNYFGVSVSIDGDYAIVGAYWSYIMNAGSAYIFKRDGTDWSEQAKLVASDGTNCDNFGVSVSISGDYAIIGAYYDDDYGYNSGSAYIFKRDGANWSEQAKLLGSEVASEDYFGQSVSINGDYAIIGAWGNDIYGYNSGSAYIFKREGTSWSEQANLMISDAGTLDCFGWSVSIRGDFAIVGAPQHYSNGKGNAYIFKRNISMWVEQMKLTASDGASGNLFGESVSISGDYAIVGASGDDENGSDSGSAYIYTGGYICGIKWHDTNGDSDYDGDEQVIESWRIYIDVNENGQFDAGEPNDVTDVDGSYGLMVPAGSWVVAEEDRSCWEQTYPGGEGTYSVAVGPFEVINRSFGNARPSEIHPSGWGQEEQDKVIVSDGAGGDNFGNSVSISGDYSVVGALGDDDKGSYSGSAYIFAANDVNCGEWDEVAKLVASDGAAYDYFGLSVSISGDKAIVGASYDDDNGNNSGSVYIFAPNEVDPANWEQVSKLTASDGADDDHFGNSVFLSGNTAVVGAKDDDDNGSSSGSAYIFYYDGVNWSEQAKLVASDGNDSDSFGCSVSISGDYAVVGAYGDDDNGSGSGSAYIFKREGTSWSEQAKLTASDGAANDYFGSSVSISGNYAAVGAYRDDDNGSDSGSAYVFRRDGASWYEQAKLTASDGAAEDYFGNSVFLSGNTAIVGALADDDNGSDSGSAYIFERDGASWSEQVKLVASDGADDDYLGSSVSISGDKAIVGADGDDDNGNSSGSAYMFGKVLCPSMDATGDCFVNMEDFAVFALEWLTGK